METLRRIGDSVAKLWVSWPPLRRLFAVGSMLLGSIAFMGILAWATHQDYAPLMTNLSPEDASQIVEKLQGTHTPYRLAAGGTAILVPEEQVHELRLTLAGEGLPRGGNVGFEIFDSPSFGMSHFAEQLNYHRALEGELRRTIRQLDAVRDARVHIVLPEKSFFREQEQAATASVTVQLNSGRHLSGSQVQAIVHLVSASVQGLSPQQVTLVDSAGTILAKGGESANDSGAEMDKQRALERGLEDRVQQLLVPLVGEGHSVVRVSAALDFSHVERTSEKFDPASPIVRSEQFSEERHQPATTTAQGIPGTRSNLSGTTKTSETASGADRRLETRNYEISKIVEREIGQLGKISRLSVAVLVDGVSVTAADGTKKMQERTPEEITRITELVRRTVGFDADREDQIVVQSMPFEAPLVAFEEDNAEPAWLGYAERFWRPAVLTLAALVLLFIFVSRGAPDSSGGYPVAQVLEMPRTVRELEQKIEAANLAAQKAQAGALAAAAAQAGAGATAQLTAGSGVQTSDKHPLNQARPDPARAANVLKGWLSEA